MCLNFKPVYHELARQIYPWRNVIRVSAIELGVSTNTPIAHEWSIINVPTLRFHPPPKEQIAAHLFKRLESSRSTFKLRETQKSLYDDYKGSDLMIDSLQVIKYTDNLKRGETASETVELLKADILPYIERYVRESSAILPITWPNLRPVKEKSLLELRKSHPRQELFLVVQADSKNESYPSSLTGHQRSFAGLQLLLELSSSAAWKSVRYVRASENRQLIDDVIAHIKRESSDKMQDGEINSDNQVKILTGLISDNPESTESNSNILLIHIDFSHSPLGQTGVNSKLPFITLVTSSDLVTAEQSVQFERGQQVGNSLRSRRSSHRIGAANLPSLVKRSVSDEQNQSLDINRRIKLMALYVNQTYTETKEDRAFVNALSKLDRDPTSTDIKKEVAHESRDLRASHETPIEDNVANLVGSPSNKPENINQNEATNINGTLAGLINGATNSLMSLTTTIPPPHNITYNINNLINDQDFEDDYEDKLKAIRYIFLQEIPRKSLSDKSLVEKQDKLNTLLSLVSVIKAYFPLPDAASVQFIDGIQNYLMRQQQTLSSLIQTSPSSTGNIGFDTRSLKQELKRLESEGKHLPEIKDWKHCKFGGYSCALWRLFHTLTAFEYRKLIQINLQSTSPLQQSSQQQPKQLPPQISLESQSSLLSADQKGDQHPMAASLSSSPNHEHDQQNSPVGRHVSPPSTTTSLSLTIATPISTQNTLDNNNSSSRRQHELDLLPSPVLLVMRDYITQFFSCEECARKFRLETEDLSFERIRQREPPQFSVLWLWETHNRVSKRLSINPETNPPEHPKKWFPSYNQCPKCYKKPPSYLKETNLEMAAIFHESIEWNMDEVLAYLLCQYTRQPMDKFTNIFGYQVPFGVVIIVSSIICLVILLRCASLYIESQRKHKASLLNGNGYSMELQQNNNCQG